MSTYIKYMGSKQNTRKEHDNGIYHREYSHGNNISKHKLYIHVDINDMKDAYDVISPIADENNLSISFIEKKEFYEHGNPTIVIDHTEMDDPKKLLSEMEYKLIEADVASGLKDDFKARPISGSRYMDTELPHSEKLSQVERENNPSPYEMVEIERQVIYQDGMGLDNPNAMDVEGSRLYREAKAKIDMDDEHEL